MWPKIRFSNSSILSSGVGRFAGAAEGFCISSISARVRFNDRSSDFLTVILGPLDGRVVSWVNGFSGVALGGVALEMLILGFGADSVFAGGFGVCEEDEACGFGDEAVPSAGFSIFGVDALDPPNICIRRCRIYMNSTVSHAHPNNLK